MATAPTARATALPGDRARGADDPGTGHGGGGPARTGPGARRVAAAVLVLLAAGAVATVLPRGPMTSGQSLAALGVAVTVGVVAGALGTTRWTVLAAPLLWAAVTEVVRVDAVGPTVDAPRFDGVYAAAAFVTGRGFDAVVVLLPLAVGAAWGAWVARRGHARPDPTAATSLRTVARGARLAVPTAVVVLLVAALVRPATTEPITDADGDVVPGSVAELVTVPVGGHDQSLMIRGRDVDAPVLLFLEGGPGGTALGSMRYAGEPLEEHFVVATWDQRGTGRSADVREPAATLTVEQLVADTAEVAEYLTGRFDEERVLLVGSSWGTTLGVLAAQSRPDLFLAYVGAGQMVDQQETDRLMWAESLAYAERVGDDAFAARLREIGEPPYDDALLYPVAIASNPEWQDYASGPDHDWRSAYPANLLVAEYTLTEQVRSAAALIDTFALVYPQLQEIDFRTQVRRLEVPVLLVQGAHEAPGRDVLAREWAAGLEAPEVTVVTFERGGHTPHLDEPGRFADLLAAFVADLEG
ncbi:alpha/beta fold hydrolase [Actinotalea solisilvae]|uniref:alpha/beta fold hydrolase n=1 Tax=Actinotalea solisilvae TaxID=2072922 RepID=UPI0018F1F3C5|nr:alpha/beta hydrolase [Actinotalea solisilvae]